jgi:hypothetical protein
VMRMRRWPWVMASSSIRLIVSSNYHVGIMGRREEKYEFGLITCSIKSVPHFVKISIEIISLSNEHRRIFQVKFNFGWAGLG